MSLCGYRKLLADRARSRWLIGITSRSMQWADDGARRSSNPVSRAFYLIAKYACLLFANLVSIGWQFSTQVIWWACRLTTSGKAKPDRIKHVFVLMLENRSFDHMLGFFRLEGVDAITGQPTSTERLDPARDWNPGPDGKPVPVSFPADWAMSHDPGHEFPDVQEQLCGVNGVFPYINNSGFVNNYAKVDPAHPGEIMKCYAPEQLPVMTTLAREFAVCDHWFSSMPGPTWPNRFFIHAASSGGLDHSPTTENIASSILVNGYKFDNGTIYDRLDDEGISWTIYKGDAFPQALAISGMTLRLAEGRLRDFEDFSKHVQDPNYSTSYAFIEPDYHVAADFVRGNSQHPKDDVTRGEALLKQVYETIRNSPHWENSVLIVTHDEHGGFYDHVPAPRTVAPGDSTTSPENNRYTFDFTWLGVRVPAIVISPPIPGGTIDHTVYDHTSALATLEHIFGLLPLTERDKQANTFYHLFSLDSPRTDAPLTLPDPAQSGIAYEDESEEDIAARQLAAHSDKAVEPPDPAVQGFLHVAYLRDRHISSPPEKEQRTTRYLSAATTRAEAKRYLTEVRLKVEPGRKH